MESPWSPLRLLSWNPVRRRTHGACLDSARRRRDQQIPRLTLITDTAVTVTDTQPTAVTATPTARGQRTLTQRPTPGTDMAESDTDTGTASVTTARGPPTLTPTTTQSTVPGGDLWVWSTPLGLGIATTTRGRRSPANTTHPHLTSNSSPLACNQ